MQPCAGHPASCDRQRSPGPIFSVPPPPSPLSPQSSEAAQLPAGENGEEPWRASAYLRAPGPARPGLPRAAPARDCATAHGEVRAAAQGRGLLLRPRRGLGHRSSRWPPAPRSPARWARSPARTMGPRTGQGGARGEPGWALHRSAPPPLLKSSQPPPSHCRSAQPPPPSVGWKPRA